MKVTVERAELLKSLGHVHRVVELRNTIPILANVLIKAEWRARTTRSGSLGRQWRRLEWAGTRPPCFMRSISSAGCAWTGLRPKDGISANR